MCKWNKKFLKNKQLNKKIEKKFEKYLESIEDGHPKPAVPAVNFYNNNNMLANKELIDGNITSSEMQKQQSNSKNKYKYNTFDNRYGDY